MVIRFIVRKDLVFAALSYKEDLIGLQLGYKLSAITHKSKDRLVVRQIRSPIYRQQLQYLKIFRPCGTLFGSV